MVGSIIIRVISSLCFSSRCVRYIGYYIYKLFTILKCLFRRRCVVCVSHRSYSLTTLPLLLLLLLSWVTLLYLFCHELFYLLHFFDLCVVAIELYSPLRHQFFSDLLIKRIR